MYALVGRLRCCPYENHQILPQSLLAGSHGHHLRMLSRHLAGLPCFRRHGLSSKSLRSGTCNSCQRHSTFRNAKENQQNSLQQSPPSCLSCFAECVLAPPFRLRYTHLQDRKKHWVDEEEAWRTKGASIRIQEKWHPFGNILHGRNKATNKHTDTTVSSSNESNAMGLEAVASRLGGHC